MSTIAIGGMQQARERDRGAGRAVQPSAEHHREVDDVRAGQELRHREGFVELLRRHPALVFHDRAPRPRQYAAEPVQRHREEGAEEFGERGMRDGVRDGCWRNGRRVDGRLKHGPLVAPPRAVRQTR